MFVKSARNAKTSSAGRAIVRVFGQARRGTDSAIDHGSVELQATNLLQVGRPAVELGT
jgi:hypothetical protein